MIIQLPRITPRTRPEISSFVIATIESEGIPVPQSSRLRQMHDLYHSGHGTIEPHHRDYETALEGERDMQLLAFAFDQLAQVHTSTAYRGLLKRLVHDSILPQKDRENSPGRDAAFEIYVAGVCTAAQLLPVAFEEPDVTCSLDGTKYALAAKRLKNIQNLQKRISKAAEQIDRSGLIGIIVVDLGPAFNPNNHRIRQMPETVFYSEYEANFKVTWDEHHSRVQEIIARHRVLGIIVHDYHVRQQERDWQLAGMTFRIPSEACSLEDQRLFSKLSMLYVYGLPNQSDASTRPLVLP
jgi:hypothetical protein